MEKDSGWSGDVDGEFVQLNSEDLLIETADIPGFLVSSEGGITVALDITLTDVLKEEGLAREFVNKIQSLRKNSGFEVTDKIKIKVEKNDFIALAIKNNFTYICDETLAVQLDYKELNIKNSQKIELIDNLSVNVSLEKY